MKHPASLLNVAAVIAFCGAITGCLNPQDVHSSVNGEDRSKLSVGAVQRSVRVGMSDAEVAEQLGSPNIVSTDDEGRNVWIYDRVTTSVRATAASGPLTLLVGGGAAAAERSNSTLTIIVKFDKAGKVRDLAYHSSKF
jgi:outer membrane protein assembly factor BamE (lipoprotein component of BamABCDE complex)